MTYPDNPTAWIERLRECWTHQSVFEEEPWNWRPPRKRRKPRKLTLATALKEARKMGVAVSGATMQADGSVSLTFGEPEPKQTNELDRWRAKRNAS